jgi:hypothetical protein
MIGYRTLGWSPIFCSTAFKHHDSTRSLRNATRLRPGTLCCPSSRKEWLLGQDANRPLSWPIMELDPHCRQP